MRYTKASDAAEALLGRHEGRPVHPFVRDECDRLYRFALERGLIRGERRRWEFRRSFGWIQFAFYSGGFWIRVFGRGVSVRNKERFRPLFSERSGSRRVHRVGKWGIEFLTKA